MCNLQTRTLNKKLGLKIKHTFVIVHRHFRQNAPSNLSHRKTKNLPFAINFWYFSIGSSIAICFNARMGGLIALAPTAPVARPEGSGTFCAICGAGGGEAMEGRQVGLSSQTAIN